VLKYTAAESSPAHSSYFQTRNIVTVSSFLL
jgi:hypothetical protein